MSNRPPVKCIMKIDGRFTNATISPYVCKHGFWLWNDAPSSREYFNISLCPDALSTLLQEQRGQPFATALVAVQLGDIDENRGYSAADMGPITRPITSLRFALRHTEGVSIFRFEGRAGQIDPRSVYDPNVLNVRFSRRPESYQFEIEFEIPDEDLPLYFVSSQALEAIKAYIQTGAAGGTAA